MASTMGRFVCGDSWRARATVLGLALIAAMTAAACGSSDPAVVAITIVSPADGARVTFADDEDAARPGVQVTVTARVGGIDAATAIELRVDGTLLSIGAATPYGDLTFVGITLPPGEHELSARTVTGSVASEPSSYTLAGLTFVDPRDGSTVTASEDEDPSTPATQRSISVQAFGLPLGEEISLHIDDVEVATKTAATDGSVVFSRQTLTAGTHTLQALAGDLVSDLATISVDELCPRIDLITPTLPPTSDSVVFGPQHDVLGPTCGDEFALDVVAATDAGDGTTLTVLINGSARGTAIVSGTVARFGPIVFGNRGSTPARLSFEPEAGGAACRREIPTDLLIDCEGVSCQLTSPASGGYLNALMDRSLAAGYQGDFEVTTELSAIGRPVALIIDGDALDLRSTYAVRVGSDSVATFAVSLTEGLHRMMAICTDPTGNVTTSGQSMWTVDTIACGVAINSPRANAYFLDTDDVDVADGTQIDVTGTVSGGDCDRARAAVCGALPSQPFLPISGTMAVARVTLTTTATQSVCLEVQDVAGNLSQAQTEIFFDSDAPLLSIRTPTFGTGFNLLGNDVDGVDYVADLVPATSACDVAFEVRCSDLATDVTLHEHVSGQAIPGAVATCEPAVMPAVNYPGVARFASVELPRLGTVAVHARQAAAGGRLVGISSPITLIEDCSAPTLTISAGTETLCGAVLGPTLDGSGNTSSSITRDVTVESDDPTGVSQTRLRVIPVSGGAPIADLTDSDAPFVFNNVNFSALGAYNVVVDAVDQAGNAALVDDCEVSVVDAPALTLDIAEGSDADEVIEAEDDCDAAAGLQISISGTTDAPGTAVATITVSGVDHTPALVCAGMVCSFTACVDAPEGLIVIRAEIADPAKPTAGVIERRIVIDSLPPTLPITDFTADVPAPTAMRSGSITFRWTDVADTGDIALAAYELRCAPQPITDELSWNAAALMPITLTPGSAGTLRSVALSGFRLYETRHCTLRGVDRAGAATPLNGSGIAVVDTLMLRAQTDTGDTDQQLGGSVAAIGDVNADGLTDFLVGGIGTARVYFGATIAMQSTAHTTIVGPGDGFGERVAGLGDINGDGIADFAVGEPDSATVYVFLGRDGSTPTLQAAAWPAQLDAVTDSSMRLQSADNDRFGDSVASLGDVDLDGFADFAIASPTHDTNVGRLHVVRGRPLCSSTVTTHCLLLGSTTTLGDSGGSIDGFVLTDTSVSFGNVGTQVLGLGDINDDGHADIAIAAPGSISDSVDAQVVLWLGIPYADSDSGMVAIDLSGATSVNLGGPEAVGVIALGALRSDIGTSLVIRFDNQIRLGALDTSSSTPLLVDEFSITNDLGDISDVFGHSLGVGMLAGLPEVDCDIDGDGVDELWVGSDGLNGVPGAAELFYRSSLAENADSALLVPRSSADHTSRSAIGPRSVTCLGDVNGDGRTDLLTADPADNSSAGRLTLLY